jgi:hypothetical protein
LISTSIRPAKDKVCQCWKVFLPQAKLRCSICFIVLLDCLRHYIRFKIV